MIDGNGGIRQYEWKDVRGIKYQYGFVQLAFNDRRLLLIPTRCFIDNFTVSEFLNILDKKKQGNTYNKR